MIHKSNPLLECSGIHRSLGTHISKVRSLTLDSASFTPDIVHLLLSIGNAKSNAVWESQLHDVAINKPTPIDSRDIKLKYIQAKYVDKSLVKPIEPITSPMELLYTAIEHDDIPRALYAIALGANVNEPLPSDTVIPIIKKKKYSTLRLPLLDVDGNEYLDRTLEIEQQPPKEEDLLIVRYALHYALLPHSNSMDDCESSTTATSSGMHPCVDDTSSSNNMSSSSSSTHTSSSHNSSQHITTKSRIFSMAEFLFQNGADVAIIDPSTGCLLADLIGLGELVDDEAIVYLNMKNSLRGQSPIVRSQIIPNPPATHQ